MNAQLPRDRSLLISIQIQKNLQISKDTNANKYEYKYKWSLLIQLDIYKPKSERWQIINSIQPHLYSPHNSPPPFLALSQSRACLIPSLQRVFARLIPTSILRVCFCICAASCACSVCSCGCIVCIMCVQ